MSFDIHDVNKHEGGSDMFFGQKTCNEEKIQDENSYHSNIVVPKDLFESITDDHYLHDDTINANELLDSLVEKGCEDNQILGNAFDKLAHLVGHNNTEYNEEDEDMLLHDAPVTDIIERLEQSMSPGQSSITAAQGLLHLQQMSEELAKKQLTGEIQSTNSTFNDGTFEQSSTDCNLHENSLQVQLDSEQENENLCDDAEDSSPKPDDDIHTPPTIDESLTSLQLDLSQEPENLTKDTLESPAHVIEESYNNLVDVSPSETLEMTQTEKLSTENEKSENNEFIDNPDMLNDMIKEAKDNNSRDSIDTMLPTDLSFKPAAPPIEHIIARDAETTDILTDNMSDKSDELPKDLSFHRRTITPGFSPKTLEMPRPPSRESDAMQSPQPSGIPAIPSSPELFTAPYAKSNKSLFLETLLASPSPKMCFSSELTITKHQSEPLNLGKHRKSASPTVSSCSDEIKKMQKEYGEPEEKRIKKESAEAQAKVNKIVTKTNEETEEKQKKGEKPQQKSNDDLSPLKQLQILKLSQFSIPDPLLVPKEKLNDIIAFPGREIPALLRQRPELRLPNAFGYPSILQDPDILVISLSQLENILENNQRKQNDEPQKQKEQHTPNSAKSTSSSEPAKTPNQPEGPAKQIPSMEALAGDIDAATTAALNQMFWLPYLSQLEAAFTCSQNSDFLKALNSSGYSSQGSYADLTQMFGTASRFMNPGAVPTFPMMSQMDYNNQLDLAMWQEAMNQTANAASQRASSKHSSAENQLKELVKAVDAQNTYLHSPKNIPSRSHSAARTSPIAHNYNVNCQRNAMNHANQFFPGMYPNMNANIRPNVPLPGLQIPHYNPNVMAGQAQRSSRGQHQQKSPTSPYFHNNNYLQSLKQSSNRIPQSSTQKRSSHSQELSKDGRSQPSQSRPPSSHSSTSHSTDDTQKPRISVKSLHNLLEPSQATAHQSKRMDYHPYHQPSLSDLMAKPTLGHAAAYDPAAAAAASHSAMKMRRQMLDASLQRRMLGHDEGEVGSTTAHDDAAAAPLHADPQTHLWHPLFGNQKGYNSPWNWTTVTVNGE